MVRCELVATAMDVAVTGVLSAVSWAVKQHRRAGNGRPSEGPPPMATNDNWPFSSLVASPFPSQVDVLVCRPSAADVFFSFRFPSRSFAVAWPLCRLEAVRCASLRTCRVCRLNRPIR